MSMQLANTPAANWNIVVSIFTFHLRLDSHCPRRGHQEETGEKGTDLFDPAQSLRISEKSLNQHPKINLSPFIPRN